MSNQDAKQSRVPDGREIVVCVDDAGNEKFFYVLGRTEGSVIALEAAVLREDKAMRVFVFEEHFVLCLCDSCSFSGVEELTYSGHQQQCCDGCGKEFVDQQPHHYWVHRPQERTA